MVVKSIVMNLFSSEWHIQAVRSGTVAPQETDKVSTLTADSMDSSAHFFSKGSGAFRLAFVILILLVALGGLAPRSLGISTVIIERNINMRIGNLTMGHGNLSTQPLSLQAGMDPIVLLLDRAASIIRTEQIENTTFKYDTPSNWVIPTPASNFMTDEFDRNRIFPLWPSYLGTANFSSTGYLFLGSNSAHNSIDRALGASNSAPPLLNLDGLLTVLAASVIKSQSLNLTLAGPLITLLICDPHIQISGGLISLATNGSLSIISSDHPLLRNVPLDAANLMLSAAIINVVENTDAYGDGRSFVNGLSSLLFFPNAYNFKSLNEGKAVKPLPLIDTSTKMNVFTLSGTKAFSDGYAVDADAVDAETASYGSFVNPQTNGVIQEQRLGLVTNKPLFIITCVLVPPITLLTAALYNGWKGWKGFEFSIESLLGAKLMKED
ncbi:hypothetical protein M422DRAFT_246988 [Sphaerobolus stellatus SS14]|nr:hypothetical protein M422DRAFT_246988 [Sphaerobolus stellatus SS14]